MILLWIANAVFLGLFAWLLYNVFNLPETRPYFIPALAFKLMAGIGVGMIYVYYYRAGDTLRFHDLAAELHNWGTGHLKQYILFLFSGRTGKDLPAALTLAEEPRTLFFVKFLSILNFLSGGNYWINSLYLSMLSFAGSWWVVKEVTRLDKNLLWPVLISFAFLPTMVFWSSGVLKESLAAFTLGILISIFLKHIRTGKIKPVPLLVFILTCWVYWEIKYYLAAVLVVAMLSVILADMLKTKVRYIPAQALVVMIFILSGLGATLLHPNFSLGRIIGLLYENHIFIMQISQHRNVVPFIPVTGPLSGFLVNIPVSLFAGLFMPLPFQGDGLIVFVPGIVNLFILLSSVFLLSGKIVCPSGKMRLLLTGAVLYIITLSVMLAWSTPNFGTLERYKTSYLPVYLLIILAGLWPGLSGNFRMIPKT